MPPSSLIFAVIVAVWAAYVIQHWIRRREHVATARSVDRFSEAMRVLERRHRSPQVDLSEPTPRSYSVSLMRPAAPDVVIKRAQPSAPMSAASSAPLAPETPVGTGLSGAHAWPEGVTAPRAATSRGAASAAKPRVSAARMRGIALLSAVAIFAASLVAAVTGLVTWWAVPIAAGVVVVALAMVRRNVSRASTRSAVPVSSIRPPKPAPVPVGRRSRRSMASAGGSAAAAFASNLHGEQLTSSATVIASEAAPVVASVVSTSAGVYDFDAGEQVAAPVTHGDVNDAPAVVQPLAPGTWAPVPVPPPTYTLKAKAQPRPVRIELSKELPQDGIALSLEEESEELPSAIRGLA